MPRKAVKARRAADLEKRNTALEANARTVKRKRAVVPDSDDYETDESELDIFARPVTVSTALVSVSQALTELVSSLLEVAKPSTATTSHSIVVPMTPQPAIV